MTVIETAILGGALAVIPSIVISVIGFYANKRWESIDKGIDSMRGDLKSHNDKSDATHDSQWRAISSNASRTSKIEGKME